MRLLRFYLAMIWRASERALDAYRSFVFVDETQWRWIERSFYHRCITVRCLTGGFRMARGGWFMRRRLPNGTFEYRDMTEEEDREASADLADRFA